MLTASLDNAGACLHLDREERQRSPIIGVQDWRIASSDRPRRSFRSAKAASCCSAAAVALRHDALVRILGVATHPPPDCTSSPGAEECWR